MYDNINIISSEYHKTVDGILEILTINDFEPIPLVDLLDSLQAASSDFLEGMGSLENFSTNDSNDHICAVRSLMLTVFSTFYDVDAWCLLDDEDMELLEKLNHPTRFRINIDGVLRGIDHNTTLCHAWFRHNYLCDYLTGESI